MINCLQSEMYVKKASNFWAPALCHRQERIGPAPLHISHCHPSQRQILRASGLLSKKRIKEASDPALAIEIPSTTSRETSHPIMRFHSARNGALETRLVDGFESMSFPGACFRAFRALPLCQCAVP